MRMWMFRGNDVIDPGEDENHFCLENDANRINIWHNFEEKDLKFLNHLMERFDYLCLWRGYVFPLYDVETDKRSMFEYAVEERREAGLLYSLKERKFL